LLTDILWAHVRGLEATFFSDSNDVFATNLEPNFKKTIEGMVNRHFGSLGKDT
jgi:hypothetical protein